MQCSWFAKSRCAGECDRYRAKSMPHIAAARSPACSPSPQAGRRGCGIARRSPSLPWMLTPMDEFEKLFGRSPVAQAEARGRVNLIGEHTDYNGGFVLPALIPQKTR